MRFRIVATHLRGVSISRRDLLRADGIIGDLLTEQIADASYKGTVIVARVRGSAGGTPADELLPPLYQVTLRILAPQGMLLTGYERIREHERVTTEYMQGWWVRLP
jgi:hypothetical protein